MKILAVDPGYGRLGVAVLDIKNGVGREKLIFSDCISTKKSGSFADRLMEIRNSIKDLISKYSPTEVAIEKIYFQKNKKTAMRVSEVRGVITEVARSMKLEVVDYNPKQIKVAVTGDGGADKKQVESMVRNLIDLKKDAVYDDEIDAIAVGLTHSATTKRKV